MSGWTFGRRTLPGEVIGYGGCWLIAGEAHISTIAVHPAHRGKGLGELLLASMLKCAIRLGGEYSVLEVRESNATAQALYRKYEYMVIGRRRQYYRDNGEDALLMEARPLDSAYYQRIEARLATPAEIVDACPIVDPGGLLGGLLGHGKSGVLLGGLLGAGAAQVIDAGIPDARLKAIGAGLPAGSSVVAAIVPQSAP